MSIEEKLLQNKLKEKIFKNIEVSDITGAYQKVLAFIEQFKFNIIITNFQKPYNLQ